MMSDSFRREILSVIGLGYVGLPVAVAFSKRGHNVVGFDVDERRISELRSGHDRTGEIDSDRLREHAPHWTGNPDDLRGADIHIVAVPTPIDAGRQPDLSLLRDAAATVGDAMRPGAIVVFESTVFPGATEEVAVPVLERHSGLTLGRDFEVGYSPERINPGDQEHRFETVAKVVSASSPDALSRLADLYGSVIDAPIHLAPSIRVAEAAKVIENTQRDLNIALMNELAMVFHRLGIDTNDVLDAAASKWNFPPFRPGLVGGHCIGVDPYYLTHKALEVGHTPQVVLAGRGTNEEMARFVATQVVQECVRLGRAQPLSVIVLGITFKANIPDIRNSKVADLVTELEQFGVDVQIADPHADPRDVESEYGLIIKPLEKLTAADAVVLAVPHREFLGGGGWPLIAPMLRGSNGLVADISTRLSRDDTPDGITLWRL